ncbi:MAG: glutathione S-transferase [Xanthomonadaceae bacterium]|nr:glutathione S-transferase [Xanthomonadaceae bacterium]
MKLVIGNKNYSSWSLRPWLALRVAGIAFAEQRIPLDQPDSKARMLIESPAGKVPVLVVGDLVIWDSLAICEYLAERYPDARLWPLDPAQRARARAISAEMHSGFAGLRSAMPMNCRGRHPDSGRTAAALADIERISALWSDALAASGGPFLFGHFTIADAMYAPVAARFVTYAVALPPACAAYVARLQALPAMVEWNAAAATETEWVAADEPYSDPPAAP